MDGALQVHQHHHAVRGDLAVARAGGLAGLQQVELVLEARAAAGQDPQAHAVRTALGLRRLADVVGGGGGDRHERLAGLLRLARGAGARPRSGLLLLEGEGAVRRGGGGGRRLSHSRAPSS